MKRAVIYIRTSSEHQAEKSSPDEQESDCRKLAIERGLEVIKVYKDTEKYRAKTRLVEPSGTRADRPGLLAMLRDGAAGKYDVILAWREDRLYRGMRAMLLFLETIQENRVEVILARDTFDPKMAPLKAWVAQMELDGMKERMTMGVKARLRAGKANCGQDRYGYQRNGEVIEVVEGEALWIRKIFEWYNQRMSFTEIRQRLIGADAPQKGSTVPRKIKWARSSIESILKAAKEYTFGIKIQTRAGEAFEIPVPPIIELSTYQRYLEVRALNTKHNINHPKREYLILGLIYCPCNRKWQARTNSYTKKNRRGEKKLRKSLYGTYYCPQFYPEHIHPNCPRTIGTNKADELVWQKVCEVINKPEILITETKNHVERIRQQAETLLADKERIENELETILLERQWVITQARKGKISDQDMDNQLGILTNQEKALKDDLEGLGETVRLTILGKWEEKARLYFEDLKVGLESLNAAPQTDEERHDIFLLKRQIVQTLVERIYVQKNRELQIDFRLNVLALMEPGPNFSEIGKVEIYTHTPTSLARPHHCEVCG